MGDPGDGGRASATDVRRAKLEALQATARELVRARSETEIATVTVETARDVLDCPITGVWLYDPGDDVLKPVAVTDQGRELLGEPVSFEPGESLAWEAFETGEVGVYDDVASEDGVYNPDTAIRAEIDIPIGRHGVLTSATTERTEFTDADVDLLHVLAANAEAVFDRAEREREITRYQEMVEAASDPIWALDRQGRVTHANQRFVDLSPHPRDQLIGSGLSTVFPAEVTARIRERIRQLRTGHERSTIYEETVSLPGGEQREFRIALSLLSEEETFAGTVFVAHDVTELRGNQQRLSVFNRILRHNLRNQLNVIMGNLEWVLDHDEDRSTGPAAQALAAAEQLMDLGEKTQRFRSITQPGAATITTLNVSAVTRRAVEAVSSTHPDIPVRTSVPDEAWANGHGTFEFAIREVVENAIEHDESGGGVDVSVTVADGGETVAVHVADTGPGIPKMERQTLQRRLESPLEHGTGLGLWLVRWTVTTAGGSIEIRDNEPRGSIVILRLPAADPPDAG